MRPAQIKGDLLDEIEKVIIEAARRGEPVQVLHDAAADRRTKAAILPHTPVHKSIVCRHVNDLLLRGRIDAVTVSWSMTYYGDRAVPTPIVQLTPA